LLIIEHDLLKIPSYRANLCLLTTRCNSAAARSSFNQKINWKSQLAGDDLFVSNVKDLGKGFEPSTAAVYGLEKIYRK
jgi:hypothetical protein